MSKNGLDPPIRWFKNNYDTTVLIRPLFSLIKGRPEGKRSEIAWKLTNLSPFSCRKPTISQHGLWALFSTQSTDNTTAFCSKKLIHIYYLLAEGLTFKKNEWENSKIDRAITNFVIKIKYFKKCTFSKTINPILRLNLSHNANNINPVSWPMYRRSTWKKKKRNDLKIDRAITNFTQNNRTAQNNRRQ